MISTTGRRTEPPRLTPKPPWLGHGPRGLDRRRGFTLLELIMVMLILCTALAVVAPSLRGFWQGAQPRHAALQILALARWARSQSMAGSRIHCLRLDPQSGTYHLEAAYGLGYEPLLSEFGRVFTLPEGCLAEVTVTPGAEPNCIRFYPNGRTDGIRILVRGQGSEDIAIVAPSPTEDFELRGDEEANGI